MFWCVVYTLTIPCNYWHSTLIRGKLGKIYEVTYNLIRDVQPYKTPIWIGSYYIEPMPLETRAQNVFLPVRDMVLINLLFYKSDWDEVCTQRHPKKETETNSPAHELDLLVQGKLKLKRLKWN